MKNILHLFNHKIGLSELDCFKEDLKLGLMKAPKSISSKYLYDNTGSILFNRITKHKDYYPTNCELEILKNSNHRIAKHIKDKKVNVIELGPGEGIKTILILDSLLLDHECIYFPIDVSELYLEQLADKLQTYKTHLPVQALHADYMSGLHWISKNKKQRNFVIFLGSNIGNFDLDDIHQFLTQVRESLENNDYLLIGFDLRKNIDTLMRAYDDSDGITRSFNFNILKRINRELGGHFNLQNFQHLPYYNHEIDAMQSYLVSQIEQKIKIDALNSTYHFDPNEMIHIENSLKFHTKQIASLAKNHGFQVIENFYDNKRYFNDSLWRAI